VNGSRARIRVRDGGRRAWEVGKGEAQRKPTHGANASAAGRIAMAAMQITGRRGPIAALGGLLAIVSRFV